jgi:autotransporter-associated beta strand protein
MAIMARKRLLYYSMKPHLAPTRRSVIILLFGRVRLGWLLVTFWLFTPQLVFGTDREWIGTTNTTWSTTTNWNGGVVPGNTDNAVFDNTFNTSNQPNLGAIATAGGLWMKASVGQNVTISGLTLTLNGTSINGTAGLGILMDSADAFNLTISAPLKLNAAQTWRNNSGSLLTIGTGGVNTNNKAFTIDGSGNTTISGIVSSGGAITKTGSGTLTFSGVNTYTGTTTVSAGILNIQSAAGLGATSAGTTVSSGATLQLQSGITVGAEALTISGTGATGQNGALVNVSGTNNYGGLVTLGAATTISSDSGTLNLTNAGTITGATFGLTLTGAGNGTVSSIIGTTTGALTKNGTGTWTLSGANTYTGATTVNGGTLLVNGSTAANSNVSVNNSGTTLGGTGTINGAVTVGNGAKLLGGTGSAASGTLTLSNSLTLNTGSIIELALGATSGAHSTITRSGIGLWTFDAHQAFTFINLGVVPGTTYTNIITGLGSDPGESNWAITNAGWSGSFSYASGNISVDIVAVPEPATWIAGALALGAVGWTQRRRFSRALKRA